MKKIKLDVTDLVERVKKENQTFYPVIMHILLKTYGAKAGSFFFEMKKGQLLQTTFDLNFDTFYQNYALSCLNEEYFNSTDKGKICFLLFENSDSKADFVLLPFETKNNKIYLPVLVKVPTLSCFEDRCQKAVLDFLF